MEGVVTKRSSSIKHGDYIVINNRPCKVRSVTTSKTGKHGGCKNHFEAIDIFTYKLHTCICTSTDRVDVPIISSHTWTLLGIDEDGFVSWLTPDGNVESYLRLPEGTLGKALLKAVEEHSNAEIKITVQKAIGHEMIHSFNVVE